jgi:3-methyl-2-oxobutanoate hydroxymethyltransferase
MKRVRVPDLKDRKAAGKKISVLTAYDYTMATLLDRAGVDVLLVGDSLGMVVLGYETTLPVTLEMMIHHTRAVSRGARSALVVADMPFLSYQITAAEAVRNAGRLLQEGGAAAVKLEGGEAVADVVKRLVDIGIPVMGHLGLTPQSVHSIGGFRQQARTAEAAARLMDEAHKLEEAGVFAVVLESIPAEVARTVTQSLAVPSIGIGAGPFCDGQVLVSYDVLGLYEGSVPPFAKKYIDLAGIITDAAKSFVEDVQSGRFPGIEGATRDREMQERKGR